MKTRSKIPILTKVRRFGLRVEVRYRSARVIYVAGRTLPYPWYTCGFFALIQFLTNGILPTHLTFKDEEPK